LAIPAASTTRPEAVETISDLVFRYVVPARVDPVLDSGDGELLRDHDDVKC